MGDGLTVLELHLHDGISLGRLGKSGLGTDDELEEVEDETSGPGFGVLLLVLLLILAAVAASKLLGGEEADESLAALGR